MVKRRRNPVMLTGWVLLVSAVLFLCHCLYPAARETSGPGGVQVTAASVFSHAKHEAALKKDAFLCTDCHLYDVAYLSRDRAISDEVTRALTRAGLDSCHFCHREHPERAQTALKCVDCHVDLKSIMPENHRAGWQRSHGTQVSLSAAGCDQCHSPRYCIECHTRRDQADRRYHTGSALISHPVEARADPARCQACHNPAYCARCHRTARF